MRDLCQLIDNRMIQKKIWEDEIPEWLNILRRLNEVNAEDADDHFIKDIEEDYKDLPQYLSLIHISEPTRR